MPAADQEMPGSLTSKGPVLQVGGLEADPSDSVLSQKRS